MAHGDDAAGVELILAGVVLQAVERGMHVLVGAGVAAAFFVDSAVFDVPDGNALAAEGVGDVAHLLDAAELDCPAAAMHQHHHRERARTAGPEQLGVLRGGRAIDDLRRCLRAVQGQVVVQGHGGGDGALCCGQQGGGDQGGGQGHQAASGR